MDDRRRAESGQCFHKSQPRGAALLPPDFFLVGACLHAIFIVLSLQSSAGKARSHKIAISQRSAISSHGIEAGPM